MEPVFNTRSDFIRYSAFKQHISLLSLFLDLKNVNHFSALSKYFNNILNNPRSDFGRIFWKNWAVKNGGIKAFKGKNINFKFKLMKANLDVHLKKAKRNKLTTWNANGMCENCNKMCYPEKFEIHLFEDRHGRLCNCEITNCISKLEMMKREIAREKQAIIMKERVLIYELKTIGVRMEKVKEKEEKLKSVSFVAKMKLAFENVKENDRYKSIRTQAGRALKQIGFFNNHNVKERKNANYRAEH